ncbi:hypothetical protein V8E53_009404, partial [Lactarius tabidus]
MKSLEAFGIVALSASTPSSTSALSSAPSPSTSLLPCPGLTDKDCASISQYFSRTCVTSAGGEDLHSVARSLFADEFKNLSSEKKELVRLKQKKTHTWSIDHLMKTIHAIGKAPCEGNAVVARDGSVKACKSCQALLTLHAFKKAVSRKPAPNKNRSFIPHIYQPAEVGKMYSIGFNDLIDGVCTKLYFRTHRQLISTLTRFVRQVVAGNLDEQPVFLDLVQVLTVQAERRERGTGYQNMKYPPAIDDW